MGGGGGSLGRAVDGSGPLKSTPGHGGFLNMAGEGNLRTPE